MVRLRKNNRRRSALNNPRVWFFVALTLPAVACGSTPTEPERHGIPQVTIACTVASDTATVCRAPIGCALYPCASGTPSDVTQTADWKADDPSVATVVGPGIVLSVGVGNTVLRVAWKDTSFTTTYFIPIAVFNGTAPLPTYEYEGTIYDGGGPPRTPLNGASVEILAGLVAGRQTISGNQPDFFPGATIPPPIAGHYAFFGIPSGTYRLRVSKPGFVTQEVDTKQLVDVVLISQQ
jgi:hypothetical protein